MGVLNLTPDSFYDGGRHESPSRAVEHGLRMAEEGADILDLGGESTRPGSDPVSREEEWGRVKPVLEALRRALPETILSVDTSKAGVAEAALAAGADMVNDVSSGRADPSMIPLCADHDVPLVLMHMRGRPKTMQEAPSYGDPVLEVLEEIGERVEAAEEAGLGPGKILVDPGIGFGKRPQDNLRLLAHLEAMTAFGHPVLVGVSRKSLIGHLTGAEPEGRLPGTLALHAAALLRGARIFRVHDVAEHTQALRVLEALMGEASWPMA